MTPSSPSPTRPEPKLEAHPLVKHYGLPLDCLKLTKAHRSVEGEHREAAWRVMLDHLPEGARTEVVAALKESVDLWKGYRDDVAEACGLMRGDDGNPTLRSDLAATG